MPKRYFAPNQQKRETNLSSILIGVVIVAAMLFGAGRLYSYFSADAPPDPTDVVAMEETGTPVTPRTPSSANAATSAALGIDAEYLRAEAELKSGNVKRAREILEQVFAARAQSPGYPEAATRLARVLLLDNARDRALELLNDVREKAPAPWRAAALNGLASDAEAQGDRSKALSLYEQAFKDSEPESAAWNEALDNLGRLNVELIFDQTETPDSKVHLVQSGENLTSIGIKLNTTQGLLTIANGIYDPASLRVDQRLKYTPKDFRLLVERSTCRMFLLDSEGVFKRYYTGLGMPGYETALGSYTIGNKQKDPTWFKPGSEPIPANDPRNELGTRWMPLMPQEEGLPTDLGIHGTIEPETIGQYKSHGCPRLKKEDVEELYDLVVRSTPVLIVEKIDWETLGPQEMVAS